MIYNFDFSGNLLTVSFGETATNDELVKFVDAELTRILAENPKLCGPLLKISGPASLPISFVLCHKLSHLYGTIGIYDPKLAKFVVSVSHSPDYSVGDLID